MELTTPTVFARLLQTRRFVRAPIWFYRRGLGWLFGSRILMLEHLGRTSGQARYVCLEVVERSGPSVILVASGFGTQAQWYRNLRVHPDCFVSIGTRSRVPARARFLSGQESVDAIGRYRDAHPRAWKHLHGAIESVAGGPVETLPMVEFTLRTAARGS